jgi:predicted acetyltransferase
MKFELIEAKSESSKIIIANLMQLYKYNLSIYEDESTDLKLDEYGLFKLGQYFNLFWQENNRFAFILKCDDEIAGFALVRLNEKNMYEISEFFVLEKFRKCGAGAYMAGEIFKTFKGNWEIRTLLKNKPAQSFWRKIISNISNSQYQECLIRNNTRYAFYFKN